MSKSRSSSPPPVSFNNRIVNVFRGLPKDVRAWVRMGRDLPEPVAKLILDALEIDYTLQEYIPEHKEKDFLEGALGVTRMMRNNI